MENFKMQYVDQLPLPVPSRTDPANFSVRGDNFLGALPDYSTQLNALATEVNAANVAAESSKNLAKTSEINAQASAFAAAGSANSAASNSGAILWVSGTTYAIGDLRYSPANGRTYRRKTAGAGTTDPSLDTTNWYPVLLEVSTLYPNIRPSLNLDFINSKQLDPRITFTRSTTAKYFDGKTYHKAEENLLVRSEEFDDAAWGKFQTTVIANSTIGPFGLSTADTLMESTSTSQHALYSSTVNVSSGNIYTFSIYVKYNTRQFVQLLFDATNGFSNQCYANFDIQNGVVGTIGSAATATISHVGNSWYRCSITCTASSNNPSSSAYFCSVTTANASYYPSFTGSNSNLVYIFGAQVEQRSSLGPYVGTTTQPITNYQMTLVDAAVNQPRFDHDPVTGERKGLFIEDSATNLLTYSEDFGNAVWTKNASTVFGDFTIAPDGTKSADKLVETTATDLHYVSSSPQVFTSGVTYTFSIYAKASTGNVLQIVPPAGAFPVAFANFNLTTGTIGSQSGALSVAIISAGNGWYRCSLTLSAISSTYSSAVFLLEPSDTSPRADAYTGDGYSGIYIWGAQLEANSASPSSYVATTSTTATRSYDLAQLTGNNFSSWYNQQEGSILAEVKMDQKPLTGYFNNIWFAISDGSANNLISSVFYTNGSLRSHVYFNNTVSAYFEPSTWSAGEVYKSTIAFASDNFAGCFNSGTVSTDNSGVLPKNLTTCYIGCEGAGASLLRGYIRKFQYYPKRLSNTELQALSAL